MYKNGFILPGDDISIFDTSIDQSRPLLSLHRVKCKVWDSVLAHAALSGWTNTWMYGGSALLPSQ